MWARYRRRRWRTASGRRWNCSGGWRRKEGSTRPTWTPRRRRRWRSKGTSREGRHSVPPPTGRRPRTVDRGSGGREPERRLLARVAIDALKGRLEEFEGPPPEAISEPGFSPPVFG